MRGLDAAFEAVRGPAEGVAAADGPNPGAGQRSGTPREGQKSAKSKSQQNAATTGANADFPILGMTLSHEPASHAILMFKSRLNVWKWKKFTWLVRAAVTYRHFGRPWKRNCRWLANMYGAEMAARWGHLGACVRQLRGTAGPPLMK